MRSADAILICGALLFLGSLGCSSPSVFPDSPTGLTLYSLDFRDEESRSEPKNEGKERFGKYLVIGRTEIKDSAKRETIMAAVNRAIGEPAEPKKCFWPRHGLKIVDSKGTTELVICFHCSQYISTGARPSDGYETISDSPQELLNNILKEASIEVVPEDVN